MGTPQAVLDAEAEVDRLIEQMSKDGTPPSDGTGDEGTPPAGEAQKSSETSDETPPPAKPESDESDLQAKYNELQEKFTKLQAAHDTLRGKTYAEIPRVIAENKNLLARIADLEAKLTAQPAPTRGQEGEGTPAKVTGKAAEILASLKEDVNEDIADKIERLARSLAEEIVTSRVTQVEGKVETFAKTAQEQAEERYVNTLTQLVPDWREHAGTEEYQQFLGTRDELSGLTMYDLAKRALDRLDANHMAVFYNKFKQLKGIGTAQKSTEDRSVPKGKEALIAPKAGTRTTERTDAGGEKPDLITVKELERLQRDMKSMSEAEEMKVQARIDRAIQRGWIVP